MYLIMASSCSVCSSTTRSYSYYHVTVSMQTCPHLCYLFVPVSLVHVCAVKIFFAVPHGVACLSQAFPTSPLPLLFSLSLSLSPILCRVCGQALERQKEYFDCIRNERDELRDELADIKGKAKAGEVGPPECHRCKS